MNNGAGEGAGSAGCAHYAGEAGPAPEARRRMSARRKQEAVLRLLRGEDLERLSRELSITAAELSGWRDTFLRPFADARPPGREPDRQTVGGSARDPDPIRLPDDPNVPVTAGRAAEAPADRAGELRCGRERRLAAPEPFHPGAWHGATLARPGRPRPGWRPGETAGRRLCRRRTGHAEDQATADSRLRGRRLPLPTEWAWHRLTHSFSGSTTKQVCCTMWASPRPFQTSNGRRLPHDSKY